MAKRRTRAGRLRWVMGPVILVLFLVGWVNFGPVSLGGSSVYLVTSGISMEPRFHSGDLAVLRPASTYTIGEIVGYHSPRIGVVLHRIIGETDGRFIMKGDNNDFVDTYHPAPSDVVGRLVWHVPKVGELVSTRTGRDVSLAVVGLSMVGLVGVPTARDRRRNRDRRRRETRGDGGSPWRRPLNTDASWGVLGVPGQAMAAVLIVLALLALVVGADGFTHTRTSRVATSTPYQQQGVWSYSAPASGTVYPGHVATTGDPLYESVAPIVAVRFAYSLTSAVPTSLHGSASLVGILSASDGWSHVFILGPVTPASGSTLTARGTVNLLQINQYLAGIAAQTHLGIGSALTYTLAITPRLTVNGEVGLQRVTLAPFSAPLSFNLFPTEAELVVNTPTSSLTTVTHPSLSGVLTGSTTVPTRLTFAGLHVGVTRVRTVVVWSLGVILLLLIILGLAVRRARRAPEYAQIVSRYGDVLVNVRTPDDWGDVPATEMNSIDDLIRVAEFQGRLVMHSEDDEGHVFFVRDLAQTYRYRPASDRRGPDAVGSRAPASESNRGESSVAPRVAEGST